MRREVLPPLRPLLSPLQRVPSLPSRTKLGHHYRHSFRSAFRFQVSRNRPCRGTFFLPVSREGGGWPRRWRTTASIREPLAGTSVSMSLRHLIESTKALSILFFATDFIKVTGSAPGLKRRRRSVSRRCLLPKHRLTLFLLSTFPSTNRQVLPFIYLPPRTTIPAAIPPTLVPVAVAYEDDTEVSLPAAARARPSEAEGWKTYTISKEWREGMFSKKKKLVFKVSLSVFDVWVVLSD